MSPELMEQFKDWNGEALLTHLDAPTGTWFFIGLHSTVLGPAVGGTRMKGYDTLDEATIDVMRLSQGMTYKNASAGLNLGGGKGVIALPKGSAAPTGAERDGMLRRYGRFITSLNGNYYSASDVGTTAADMDIVSETAGKLVASNSAAKGGAGMTALPTAIGTYYAIQATAETLFGSPDLSGKKIAVQGAGSVGGDVIRRLLNDGAVVSFYDPSDEARKTYESLGARFVEGDSVVFEPCDILSPNALGAILNSTSIPRLNCKGIAGAANNQLATEADAELLKERGILYAPDHIVNAGGVISGACLEIFNESQAQVDDRLRQIGGRVSQIFTIAKEKNITTALAARQHAETRLTSS